MEKESNALIKKKKWKQESIQAIAWFMANKKINTNDMLQLRSHGKVFIPNRCTMW